MSKGSDMSNRSNVVLIAEDDGDLRELVSTELESEGFQVVSVTNGEEKRRYSWRFFIRLAKGVIS